MKAVILAAGLGTRLAPLTDNIPKCMVQVAGVPLIDRMIERITQAGIEQLIVVTGHMHDVLRDHLAGSSSALARHAALVFNDHFADWGNFYSLLVAREAIGDSAFIKLDADVILDHDILPGLLGAPGPAALALDCRDDLTAEDMKARVDDSGRIVALNKRMDPGAAAGESIGVERIDASLAPAVFDALAAMIEDGHTDEYYEYAYEQLMQRGVAFSYADITDALWCEVDNAADLDRAHAIVAQQDGSGTAPGE